MGDKHKLSVTMEGMWKCSQAVACNTLLYTSNTNTEDGAFSSSGRPCMLASHVKQARQECRHTTHHT